MSKSFLTPVGPELAMPERSSVAAHPAGWLVSSPDRLQVFDPTFGRVLFTAQFDGCGASTVSAELDYAAVSLRDRAQLRGADGSVVWERVHGGWPQWGTGSAYWDASTETFAFTVPGDDSDLWSLVQGGETVESVELTNLTAGGSHVARARSGHLGLSIGAGQDGGAVYWVDPRRLGEHLPPVVYDEEMVVDAGRGDAIVTLTYETDVLCRRSAVDSGSVVSVRSADIDSSIDEGMPYLWVVGARDRLVVCVDDDEDTGIFVAGAADLGSWTQLEPPTGLDAGAVLVGGVDGLCASYDWASGAVRLWHGPLL